MHNILAALESEFVNVSENYDVDIDINEPWNLN